MKQALTPSVTSLLLTGVLFTSASCGDTDAGSETIGLSIESQDNIVSETGTLELTAGTLSIRSVSLTGDDGALPMIGPVTIDLSIADQELRLRSSIPPGSYTGLRIELAPATNGAETLDVRLRSVTTEESVRAISSLIMSGSNDFPEGPRAIGAVSEVELQLSLRGMFFYLAPLADAVDGVYEAGENDRDFLTMDLIGMFDLRVLP